MELSLKNQEAPWGLRTQKLKLVCPPTPQLFRPSRLLNLRTLVLQLHLRPIQRTLNQRLPLSLARPLFQKLLLFQKLWRRPNLSVHPQERQSLPARSARRLQGPADPQNRPSWTLGIVTVGSRFPSVPLPIASDLGERSRCSPPTTF